MALHYSATGFVFKKEDRQEADRMFSVFTLEFGRIEVFAKAIRKINSKLKSGIEIFSLSELSFIQGKRLKTLTDAAIIKRFNVTIIEAPEKIEIAANVSFLLDSLIKGPEPDQKLWDLIIDFFQKLSTWKPAAKSRHLVYYYFFWNFFSVLGYEPELSACAHCRQKLTPPQLYFSGKEGGMLCKQCFAAKKEGVKVTPDAVKILRIILKKDWEMLLKLKVDPSSQASLKAVSDYYTLNHEMLSRYFSQIWR